MTLVAFVSNPCVLLTWAQPSLLHLRGDLCLVTGIVVWQWPCGWAPSPLLLLPCLTPPSLAPPSIPSPGLALRLCLFLAG